jgi:hypothetical protein
MKARSKVSWNLFLSNGRPALVGDLIALEDIMHSPFTHLSSTPAYANCQQESYEK